VNPSADLIIGVVNILQTPDQEYTKREIVQYPSMQPALIQVVTYNVETGTITVLIGDEMFNLAAGESRTFKQIGDEPKTSTLITVISNHGQLEEIQYISSDGSWR
jgi:hypothetical protein